MPSAIEHQLNEVGAKIQRGRKLFLLHDNPDGFLGVKWQGKYHLAYIVEGWNPATNQFKVLWNRKGKSSQTVETLQYKDQVLEMDTVKNVTVDDDSHHGILWTAEVVDLLQDDFINVKVRWERGDVQKVYISRLSIGGLKTRRKRNTTDMLGFDKKVTVRNVAAAEERKPLSKNDEVISIASSSSEDDSRKESERNSNKIEKEEEHEKKRPAFVAFNPVPISAAAPSSSSDDDDSESRRQSGRSGVSSTNNEDITVKKRARVSVPQTAVSSQRITAVRGFTEISPQIKEDIPETVVNILTGLDEVERGSEEYIDTLKDAVALLQEELFQLNDNTKFINAPLEAKPTYNDSRDNKDRIVYMAKTTFKLPDSQIAELFEKHLEYDDHGIYSIHDAIPILQHMSDEFRVLRIDFESNENESDDEDEHESDDSIGSESSEDIRRNFQLLGKRIKTTFEDGIEYEGNVTAVHYRVQYDDKENETMSGSEVMQNLANNDVVIGSPSMKEVGLSSLEIFSGCSLLSNYCKRKGMEAISIDKDVDSNATIKADFFNEGVQDILAKMSHDFIHASPECKYYSHMMGGKHRDKYNYNKTPEGHNADAMLLKLFYFFEKELRKNKDVTLTLENPAAWMMKGNIMTQLFEKRLNMRPYKIYYCQFGRGEKKPTCIWTNDQCLGTILLRVGGVCNCGGKHEESVKGSLHKTNFAALPTKLCNVISDYVYTKHRQLKYKAYIESEAAPHEL